MKRPISQKCASACGPATSPSCERDRVAAKPKRLAPDKPTNLRSKRLKQTQPSVLSPPLAIPLAWHFMTVNLVKPGSRSKDLPAIASDQSTRDGAGTKIDKNMLTISEPKRIRSKEHL